MEDLLLRPVLLPRPPTDLPYHRLRTLCSSRIFLPFSKRNIPKTLSSFPPPFGPQQSEGLHGVYRWTNGGESFGLIGIQPELIECIAVSPTGTIMAGTFNGAFLSTDRGVTWVQKTSGLADQYLRSVTFGTDGFAYAGTANGLYRSSVATAVADDQSTSVLGNYTLYQNYSNPFNPSTTITFNLPKSCVVRLSVYDMLGREVSVLVYEKRDAGIHEVKFDGSRLASSVYLYRLTAGSFTQTRKLVLIR